MVRIVLYAFALFVISNGHVGRGGEPTTSPNQNSCENVVPADDLIARPQKQVEYTYGVYHGSVTDVDRESITIKSPGWSEVTGMSGNTRVTVVVPPQRPDLERLARDLDNAITIVIPPPPPRRFKGGPVMSGWWWRARGGHPPPALNYQLADVKVGDKVGIEYRTINGVDHCDTICIYRRPDGRVPPAPGESPNETRPWHERCNAEQDFEEKGIPLPLKFRPISNDQHPPLPDSSEQKLTAPPPREYRLPIPPAKP